MSVIIFLRTFHTNFIHITLTWIKLFRSTVEQTYIQTAHVDDVIECGDNHPQNSNHHSHHDVEQEKEIGEQEQAPPGIGTLG